MNKKYEILTGNKIKIIAVISMFIDHLYKVILSPYMIDMWSSPIFSKIFSNSQILFIEKLIRYVFYGAGRIALPLFCFLLAEGFYYTKNKKRYIGLMTTFALISEIPFDLAIYRTVFYFPYQNIYFTLTLGLLALLFIDKIKFKSDKKSLKIVSIILQAICVLGICFISTYLKTDYKYRAILFIVGFYLTRKNRLIQVIVFLILYALLYKTIPSVFILISGIIILLYNGQRGNANLKYFFYWFYPIHLLALFLIKWLIL